MSYTYYLKVYCHHCKMMVDPMDRTSGAVCPECYHMIYDLKITEAGGTEIE
jgi:predicted RNA-binding Zn-ribbon protein involved in translation (DUF1610 family)